MAHAKHDLAQRFLVKPGAKAHLGRRNPDDTAGLRSKSEYEAILQKNVQRLFDLQTLLAACDQYAVLVVLQAMDAGGKDGTIRHVMTGLNPQACRVTSFKVPSQEETRHDFSVARAQCHAAARRDRHLQPLALRRRGGARA